MGKLTEHPHSASSPLGAVRWKGHSGKSSDFIFWSINLLSMHLLACTALSLAQICCGDSTCHMAKEIHSGKHRTGLQLTTWGKLDRLASPEEKRLWSQNGKPSKVTQKAKCWFGAGDKSTEIPFPTLHMISGHYGEWSLSTEPGVSPEHSQCGPQTKQIRPTPHKTKKGNTILGILGSRNNVLKTLLSYTLFQSDAQHSKQWNTTFSLP